MDARIDHRELEAALSRLPREHRSLRPLIRSIVIDNIHRGRVEKFLARHPQRTLADYVHQVALTLQADRQNVQRLSEGDEVAWGSLLELLRHRAYKRLRKIGVEHEQAYRRANDFAQEACCALLEASFPFDVPHTAWVTRILYNCITHETQRSPDLLDAKNATIPLQTMEQDDDFEVADPTSTEPFTRIDRRQAIEWALYQLPTEAQRVTVVHKVFDGWSSEEIAADIDRNVQAVHNLYHRALKHIKRLLQL
jgi:RNA polymerase sigma factor (sigma-70 family)